MFQQQFRLEASEFFLWLVIFGVSRREGGERIESQCQANARRGEGGLLIRYIAIAAIVS